MYVRLAGTAKIRETKAVYMHQDGMQQYTLSFKDGVTHAIIVV